LGTRPEAQAERIKVPARSREIFFIGRTLL
jgi:hypothetical protein